MQRIARAVDRRAVRLFKEAVWPLLPTYRHLKYNGVLVRHRKRVLAGLVPSRWLPVPQADIPTFESASVGFIEKALESVASQVAPFDYEILIGDDGSDDGTSALVDEFARQHEGPIRVFHRVRAAAAQSGLMNFESGRRNYWANMRAARGEFIAHLDGDDYWCSSDKLARQVRQLESTPRLSACFAAARVVDADGRDLGRVLKPSSTSEIFSLNDLLMDNPANSPALMGRKSAIAVHHDWFDRMPGVFWPTLVACALSGDIGFEDHITGCYRLHGSAVHSGRSKVRKTEWSLLGRLELRGGASSRVLADS